MLPWLVTKNPSPYFAKKQASSRLCSKQLSPNLSLDYIYPDQSHHSKHNFTERSPVECFVKTWKSWHFDWESPTQHQAYIFHWSLFKHHIFETKPLTLKISHESSSKKSDFSLFHGCNTSQYRLFVGAFI